MQKKQKRKKYQSVDHFMKDVDTMFNNAKLYNEDESQVYKDAVQLQVRTLSVVVRCGQHFANSSCRSRLTN